MNEESNDGISIKVNEIVILIGGGGCDSIRHYTQYIVMKCTFEGCVGDEEKIGSVKCGM